MSTDDDDTFVPAGENVVTWHDWNTGLPVIQFQKGILHWNNREGDAITWVRVDRRGHRFVTHVIRQVGGLLALKRIPAEGAQIALDALYAILESKL